MRSSVFLLAWTPLDLPVIATMIYPTLPPNRRRSIPLLTIPFPKSTDSHFPSFSVRQKLSSSGLVRFLKMCRLPSKCLSLLTPADRGYQDLSSPALFLNSLSPPQHSHLDSTHKLKITYFGIHIQQSKYTHQLTVPSWLWYQRVSYKYISAS